MATIEVRVLSSRSSVFNSGDVIRVEKDDTGEYISVEKLNGNKERIFKVEKNNEVLSIDSTSQLSFALHTYYISAVDMPETEIGYIEFSTFAYYFISFDLRIYGELIPVGPRSGSGGGLRK